MATEIVYTVDYQLNLNCEYSYLIKVSGSELWGQEEAPCMHVFRSTRPLQWAICTDGSSKFLKCCSSATLTAIAQLITHLYSASY